MVKSRIIIVLLVAFLGRCVTPGQLATPLKLDFTVVSTRNITKSSSSSSTSQNRLVGDLDKKAYISAPVFNVKNLAYLVDVYLGTQKQKVTVALDTGSSDLWVPINAYDATRSEASRVTGEFFDIDYLDSSRAHGIYVTDRFQLESENSVLEKFQFAWARGSSTGVLGIAGKAQQSSKEPYDNLPWALKAAGITNKASYSIFLGTENGGSGTIIFGGIDTKKYTGQLQTYHIDTKAGGLALDLKSVRLNGVDYQINMTVYLDTGTSIALVHRDIMNEMDGIFNTTVCYQDSMEIRFIDCNQPKDKFIEFNFGKNIIALSYADAVVRQPNGQCLLGFAYFNNTQILGDVFLKKAYVYCDLGEETISLAQSSYLNLSHIISV